MIGANIETIIRARMINNPKYDHLPARHHPNETAPLGRLGKILRWGGIYASFTNIYHSLKSLPIIGYPRIQIGVRNINDEVCKGYYNRDHQHGPLNNDEILIENAAHYQPAHSRDIEYGLDEYGTPDDISCLHSQQGDNRNKGVFSGRVSQ